MTTSAPSNYSAPALSRGLRILELLSASSSSKTTHDIATELGLNRNEVFRIIAVLESEKYLCKASNGVGYVLSGRLLELSLNRPQIVDVLEAIAPMASELTHKTGAPCHLALPSGDQMVVVKRWEPRLKLSVNVPPGTRHALEITASGVAMLCAMNPQDLALTLASIQARNPAYREADLAPYRTELLHHEVLRFDSKLMAGVVDVTVPIVSSGEQLHGALTVPYANNTTCDSSIEEISEALVSVSRRISKMLVWP